MVRFLLKVFSFSDLLSFIFEIAEERNVVLAFGPIGETISNTMELPTEILQHIFSYLCTGNSKKYAATFLSVT